MRPPKNRTDHYFSDAGEKHLTSNGVEFAGGNGATFAVDVLDEGLFRVHLYPQGKARLPRTWLIPDKNGRMPGEGRDRQDYSPFALPYFEFGQEDQLLTLTTKDLSLTINGNELALKWFTSGGRLLAEDKSGQAYCSEINGRQVVHNLTNHRDEHYYGFGEVSGPLDKVGEKIFLENVDNPYYDARSGAPLYKHIPFYITFNAETGQAFGLFYDNLATTVFEMRKPSEYRSYQAEDGDLDYYFIYGPSIKEVVAKFIRLTGHMILPPRWTLGFMGSTMNYTEAMDAQAQLATFSEKCRKYKIPCDLFHLSSGYTLGDDGKRYVFTWNRKRVPDPKGMVESFHKNGIRLAANIKPALLTTHPRFEEVRVKQAFIRQPASDDAQRFEFWGGTAAALDFTNPTAVDWWKRNIREQLLDYGIDSTWNDNNEFEVRAAGARGVGFGKDLPVELSRPIQTLMMMRASYEAQTENQPEERPFLISRAGAPGMQRYVQTWSGDNFTSWKTMKYNLPMGLNLSLSGVANNGHDVGGFGGPRPTPELFLRWIQNNIFHPRFTIHSWKEHGGANEPWMYPKILPLVQEAIYLRYRLIPYLYSLEMESVRTGSPINRPMVYEFPDDPQCVSESFDFMLGSSLMVAPVVRPWTRRRKVYLPAGQYWYDFYSQAIHEGGRTYTIPAPLDHIPLFVKEGGMIPMGEVVHPLIHAEDNLRQVLLFPHRENGSSTFTLVEDDGHSLAYQKGIITQLEIALRSDSQKVFCEIKVNPYQYALPYPELELILPAGESRQFVCDGSTREWKDDNDRRHIHWPIPKI